MSHAKRGTPSLRIQPPLIRSRYYVRIAKSDVVAGANERRLYSQATGPRAISKSRISCRCHDKEAANRQKLSYRKYMAKPC